MSDKSSGFDFDLQSFAQPQAPPSRPAPRIVAGLILKPSDRVNPCYLAYRVEAAYPLEAQEQRIEGVVKIQQVIGTDSRVPSVRLLSGPPKLFSAAQEAARYGRRLPCSMVSRSRPGKMSKLQFGYITNIGNQFPLRNGQNL
jgi:hypothetical protein